MTEKQKIQNIYKWYNSKEYELEKEINEILNIINFENKKILILSDYSIMAFYKKLKKFSKEIYCFSENKNLIKFMKEKNKKIIFMKNLMNIEKNYFDIILILWDGIIYNKKLLSYLNLIKAKLSKNGKLIIEDVDSSSEYVKILNLLDTNKKDKIKKSLLDFEEKLKTKFKFKKTKLKTFYNFKNEKSLIKYFSNEFEFHENKKISFDKKIKEYIKKKKTLKVEEKSCIYICQK